MNKYLEQVQESLENSSRRTFQILQEEVQRGQISKSEFLSLSKISEKDFDIVIKKQIKNLLDIQKRRYEKDYGEFDRSAIIFRFNPPSIIHIILLVYKKSFMYYYVMCTQLDFSLQKSTLTSQDFYIFGKHGLDGQLIEKIAEGNETHEFTSKGKYGELLSIKNPMHFLNSIKTIKDKI